MSRPRFNSRGFVGFIMSVVVLLVMLTISGTAVTSLRAIKRESIHQNKLLEAQALAESGARDAMVRLSANENWRAGFSQKTLGSGYYTVTLSGDRRPEITSAGYASALSLLGRPFKTVKFKAETPPIPQMTYGLIANDNLKIETNAYIDSYNSETNPAPSSFGSSAKVWSNNTVDFTRLNYTVYGDANYVTGGNPGSSRVSGNITQSTFTINIGSTSWSGYESDNENLSGLAPSSVYSSSNKQLTVPQNTEATINSGVYYFTKMDIQGTLTLNVTQGPVVVFLENSDFLVSGDLINPTSIPGNFVVYMATSTAKTVDIDQTSNFHGVIQGKTATITIKAPFYGAVAGKTITIKETARVHQDLSLQRARVNTVRVVPGTWTSSYKR